MTKTAARQMSRGKEILNIETGEVARLVWIGDTVGYSSPIYLEVMCPVTGKFYIWTNKNCREF